jgi:ATP/maltotriose-dependent transcriptional regulator MalT
MFQKLSQKSMNSYLLKDAGRGIAARGVGMTDSAHKTDNAGAPRWAQGGVENTSPREWTTFGPTHRRRSPVGGSDDSTGRLRRVASPWAWDDVAMDPSPPRQALPGGRPLLRENVVPRRRLLERLDTGLEVGAVRVHAAGGSGKTTLLASWLETLPHDVHSAWLTLRPEHNDPRRLADDLRAAGRSDGVDAGGTADSLRDDLAALLEPAPGTPGVLVLDDVHVIHDESVVDAIAAVLTGVPAGSCMVISGREDPGLPWPMMRARRSMVEVDDASLRFDEEETRRLLATVFGADDRDHRIIGAVTAAEGWAAGLVLAGVAYQAQPGEPVDVALSPRHRHFVDGFIENTLLSTCPPDVRAFLVATSVLPLLEPPLCDLLTGRDDSSDVLRALVDRNMLTEELAGPQPVFRYHALLRRALHHRMSGRERAQLADRVELAVRALDAQGRLVEATDLALQSGSPEDAEKWVRRACASAMTQGYCATVARWLSDLPSDRLHSQPDLLLVLARAAGVSGDLLTATAAVRSVHQLVAGGDVPEGVRIALQLMETAVALWQGALTASVASLQDLLLVVPEPVNDPVLELLGLTRASVLSPLAAALLMQGELDEAVDMADEVLTLDELAPLTRHAILSLGVRPLARAWAGREQEAADYVEQARPLVASWRVDANEALLFWCAAAWVGPVSQAEQSLDSALRLTSRTSIPLLQALPAVTELRVRQRLGHYDRLTEAARRAEEAVARVPEPGYLAQVLHDELLWVQRNADSPPDLSETELALLQAIADGRSRKQVAEEMHYSINTVKTYMRSAYRKLGAHDRAEAVARARAWGLLT